MLIKKNFFLLLPFIFVIGCGVPESDYNELKVELENVQQLLDECQNGEERLTAIIENAYAASDYSTAKESIILLKDNHPQSNQIDRVNDLLVKIEQEEEALRERRLEERNERLRLANLNNTGIWQVVNFVDDFGEPTDNKYIRNSSLIKGSFSNTATQNSDLNIRFLISNRDDVSIMLYEYAGNNPVKAIGNTNYRVLLQNKDGERHDLGAVNRSDRLSFSVNHSRIIHNALLKGGEVQFRINEVRTPTTQYHFSINNALYYDNAYRILMN